MPTVQNWFGFRMSNLKLASGIWNRVIDAC